MNFFTYHECDVIFMKNVPKASKCVWFFGPFLRWHIYIKKQNGILPITEHISTMLRRKMSIEIYVYFYFWWRCRDFCSHITKCDVIFMKKESKASKCACFLGRFHDATSLSKDNFLHHQLNYTLPLRHREQEIKPNIISCLFWSCNHDFCSQSQKNGLFWVKKQAYNKWMCVILGSFLQHNSCVKKQMFWIKNCTTYFCYDLKTKKWKEIPLLAFFHVAMTIFVCRAQNVTWFCCFLVVVFSWKLLFVRVFVVLFANTKVSSRRVFVG